jgi:hypothetical protein
VFVPAAPLVPPWPAEASSLGLELPQPSSTAAAQTMARSGTILLLFFRRKFMVSSLTR